MDDPLEKAYFAWLINQVGAGSADTRTSHYEFLEQLLRKPFAWFVPNDDNRVEDGILLRYEFVDNIWRQPVSEVWLGLECSFLELMIGLSRRLTWQAEGEPSEWFWHLVQVIGAHPCTDAVYRKSRNSTHRRVDAIMDSIIWRTYLPNGRGGFFPLDHPHKDQREVEIWYQMSAYLLERD